MPELPEVETIVRGLKRILLNREFSRIEISLRKCVEGSKESFIHLLREKRILDIRRRGKNIIFHLSGEMALQVHLRMTGKLRLVSPAAERERHTHIIFSFRNHPTQLRFIDARQFGRLRVEKKNGRGELTSLSHLGPEPFEMTGKEFIRIIRLRHRAIKPLLLDQNFLAGVGNIYADEALNRARIHPLQKADSLPDEAILRLFHGLQKILKAAIQAGGTSVRSYVNASGSSGDFQNFLQVYGREGKRCNDCGALIVRRRISGRSSFYCPRCQPGPSDLLPHRQLKK
jgi:formamidopyrimidine-DNA glycosylase